MREGIASLASRLNSKSLLLPLRYKRRENGG